MQPGMVEVGDLPCSTSGILGVYVCKYGHVYATHLYLWQSSSLSPLKIKFLFSQRIFPFLFIQWGGDMSSVCEHVPACV